MDRSPFSDSAPPGSGSSSRGTRRGLPAHLLILATLGASSCFPVSTGCSSHEPTTGPASVQRAAKETATVPAVDWVLELKGPGLARPRNFTYQELAVLETTRLDNILQQRTHLPDQITSWEGPSLELLLTMTEIKPGPMLLTIEAVDGYSVKRDREHLKSAIVAVKDGEGRWLTEVGDRRPLRFVPPHLTGNYWVSNLKRITVEPAHN